MEVNASKHDAKANDEMSIPEEAGRIALDDRVWPTATKNGLWLLWHLVVSGKDKSKTFVRYRTDRELRDPGDFPRNGTL